jgi:uncharacterized protein YjbI with pentapeptide repeats
MANPKHVEILKQGSEIWNKWREDNPEVYPDINNANLKGLYLRKANLSRLFLQYADLSDADLIGANISETDLWHTKLISSKLDGANLYKADLDSVNLNNASCRGTDFRHANLNFALIAHADLYKAKLQNTYLVETEFNGSDLSFAALNGAKLEGAALYNVNFDGADLTDANLSEAKMGGTILVNTDLSNIIGLDSVRHYEPSSIGIDTIYISRGKISESFLRKAGVPESFIIYMNSLTETGLEFYNCFISFTEADDQFSETLYNDLQDSGVRCWRWKEDAKWGKTLMRSIDEAVHIYDKLIVICSEQSLNSPAVIREIERALQKEDGLTRQGKDAEVLFPIRLDDYIFTEWNHHRKADVIAKNVGDFRSWKEQEQYERAFYRLLRDLKAEGKKKDAK